LNNIFRRSITWASRQNCSRRSEAWASVGPATTVDP